MDYFLVKGQITRSEYMSDEKTWSDIRLVMATNAEEAAQKYVNFWEHKATIT